MPGTVQRTGASAGMKLAAEKRERGGGTALSVMECRDLPQIE